MKKPAVFLDRDGTIIEDVGFVADPARAVLFPETIPALRRLGEHFLLFIVTNQSGVAKGAIRQDEARIVNESIVRVLAEAGITIKDVYCCPHQRSDACVCIKPKPHFGLRAEREHGVDLAWSFVVGDHPADVEFAANLGARGIYVLSGHGGKHHSELSTPCEVVPGIAQATERILLALDSERVAGGKEPSRSTISLRRESS